MVRATLVVLEPPSGGTEESLPLYFNIMMVLGESQIFSEVVLGVERLRTTEIDSPLMVF